jgi:hypothetical protein
MYEVRPCTVQSRTVRRIRAALRRLDRRLPVLCSCGHFCSKQNVKTKFTTWGARVTFCPRCHAEWFGDWRGAGPAEAALY